MTDRSSGNPVSTCDDCSYCHVVAAADAGSWCCSCHHVRELLLMLKDLAITVISHSGEKSRELTWHWVTLWNTHTHKKGWGGGIMFATFPGLKVNDMQGTLSVWLYTWTCRCRMLRCQALLCRMWQTVDGESFEQKIPSRDCVFAKPVYLHFESKADKGEVFHHWERHFDQAGRHNT